MRTIIAGLAISFIATASAGAQTAPDSIPEEVTPERTAEGAKLFAEASCRSCHGDQGRGGLRGGPSLRDNEWLHSEGDYEGIFQTIRWGVSKDRIKALSRPWEMRPRGGMLYNTEQMRALASYIWSMNNGLYEPSAEDEFIDHLFAHGAAEAEAEYQAYREQHGEAPFSEERMRRAAADIFNSQRPNDGIAALRLNLEVYPESARTLGTLGQALVATSDTAQGIELMERALELNSDLQGVRRSLEQVRAARAGAGR